jgi:hypothetical protein
MFRTLFGFCLNDSEMIPVDYIIIIIIIIIIIGLLLLLLLL